MDVTRVREGARLADFLADLLEDGRLAGFAYADFKPFFEMIAANLEVVVE